MARVLTSIAIALIAGCQFDRPNPADPIDADPDRPDGTPGVIDADLTMPDARVIPDAPPGTPDAPPDLPDAYVALCPAGYAPISIDGSTSSSSYRFVASSVPWLTAEGDCENDAGALDIPAHLAVIDDSAERAAIAGIADNQWIGLTDRLTEDTFIFVTPQAAVDTSGVTGSNAMKDCVRMGSDRSYAARDCGNSNRYVCECDGFTADPARFP